MTEYQISHTHISIYRTHAKKPSGKCAARARWTDHILTDRTQYNSGLLKVQRLFSASKDEEGGGDD